MSLKFQDTDTEQYFLACCLQGPEHWKNIPDSYLQDDLCKKSYKEYKQFLAPPYSTYPTAELVISKSNDTEVKLFTQEIASMKVDTKLTNAKLYDLYEMYASRTVMDIIERVPNDMEKTRIEEVVRAKIYALSKLVNPFEVGQRERGFIYESASARWERYRQIEANPNMKEGIPYHIEELDKYTGGMRKTHVVGLYAESGGYKTKTKANLAYNFSYIGGKHVMVVTLEVPFQDYNLIVDSRDALLSFGDILDGKLEGNREHYRQRLIQNSKIKPPLYLVDIPGDATTADLISELELYYTIQGRYPDVLILDYLNEMSPVASWNNTSEKFKNIGLEIRRIARMYKIGFLTSMQENREGKKLKDKVKSGTEHIAEGHYFLNVCHLMMHLYQDAEGIDEATNQLHWGIKKNRYGPKHVSFTTFCSGDLNYVGDKKLFVPYQEGIVT